MTIDKDALYGKFQMHQDAQNKLALTAAHKALDIPQEDMQITANRYGIGPMGLLAALVASSIPTAIALCLAFGRPQAVPKTETKVDYIELEVQSKAGPDGKEQTTRTPGPC